MGLLVLLVLTFCALGLAGCVVALVLTLRRLNRDYDAFEEKVQGRMDEMRRRTR